MKSVQRTHAALAASLSAAVMVVLGGGMAPAQDDGLAYLDGLQVSGHAGYPVFDVYGAPVGEVLSIETDSKGRTRHVRIALVGAGELDIPAFRAVLDAPNRELSVTLPADKLYQRYNEQRPS